jgi:hypothetical protein
MTVVPFPASRRRHVAPPFDRTSTCRVHGGTLIEGEAEILYGYPSTSSHYFAAERRLFPWASTYRAGGCAFDSSRPETVPTKCCAACRSVERAWKRLNRRIDAPGPKPRLVGPFGWLRDWVELVRTRRRVRQNPKEERDGLA